MSTSTPPRRHFWLTTFDLDLPAPNPGWANHAPLLQGPFDPGQRRLSLAIEVIQQLGGDKNGYGPATYAILLSTWKVPPGERSAEDLPQWLKCCLGFSNAPDLCNEWHDRGFRMIDADIQVDPIPDTDSYQVTVTVPHFINDLEVSVLQYEKWLLKLKGVQFRQDSEGKDQGVYRQTVVAPEVTSPNLFVTTESVAWQVVRQASRCDSPAVEIEVALSRYPNLAPLVSGSLPTARCWYGAFQLQDDASNPVAPATADTARRASDAKAPQATAGSPPKFTRLNRADVFCVPAYRFEQVELIGFRVELGGLGRSIDAELASLIDPLNFHLYDIANAKGAMSDFRYRWASRTLLIELIRYGEMKLDQPAAPLRLQDSQSQHELVVRLLVGRLDDDTAQARDPAMFVPAIFVDNPWSKVLGRDAQGFDKRLASFCIGDEGGQRLRPDGRRPLARGDLGGPCERLADPPEPLHRITTVRLADGSGVGSRTPLLTLDCPSALFDEPSGFMPVDLQLALNSSALSGLRWRQSDFDQAEFRRSFARTTSSNDLNGFRSIQVTPVSKRIKLDKTWIHGTFDFHHLRVARPSGITTLKMNVVEGAPDAWNLLCKMLGDDRQATLDFAAGQWYRLKCSMNLSIDDGLSWNSGRGRRQRGSA